jgi:hypothetical protein
MVRFDLIFSCPLEIVAEGLQMTPFSTEFPTKTVTTADFVAQVIGWLRGADYSTVLDQYSIGDLDRESARLHAITGEELNLRQLSLNGAPRAIGFRHDYPDSNGRLWRTESVLTYPNANVQTTLVRIRTQCIAGKRGAKLESPRKPYLVKAMLQDGWGAMDGALPMDDRPHWLPDNDDGMLLGSESVLGGASVSLPVVYISAVGLSQWPLSRIEIEKLAYDLGGIAHVVVEPSRAFSFGLRDQTSGKNAYGGSIAIALPGQGIVKRLHFGWLYQDTTDLVGAIRATASEFGSYVPARGWDWTELQEQALRVQRERDRGKISTEEVEKLYDEEIASLRERIKELQDQLSTRPTAADGVDDNTLPVEAIYKRIGPEIYTGELLDRLHLAAKLTLRNSEQIGLDERTKFVLGEVSNKLPWSPELDHLEDGLRRATKDPKRIAQEVSALLAKHGYRKKSDNKHVRLEANEGFGGLESITLPKTPSDNRGLANQRSQIERTLGLTSLRKL